MESARFPVAGGAAPRVLDLGFLRIPLDEGMTACWWRTFFPSLSLFLLTAAFIVTKTGRDALYFAGAGDIRRLPEVYLAIAILSVPVSQGALALMRVAGPRRARLLGLAAMAALQVLFYVTAQPGSGWGMTLVFVLIPLLYGVLLSMAWLLGADLLDLAPRHVLGRLYATMGASSLAGGMMGGAAASALAAWMQNPASYLLAGSALLIASLAANAAAYRMFPVALMRRQNDLPVPSTEGGAVPPSAAMLPLLRDSYVAMLAAIALAGSVVGVLIEYQFYAAAASVAGGAPRLFARFYLWLNGAAFVLQVLVTPVLQQRIGVHRSLLVLPGALVGLAAAAVLTGSAATRTVLRVAEGGLKSSVHRSGWEQTYLPVDRARRAAAKLLVDGMAARTGECVAAVALLAMPAGLLLPGLLAAAAGWLVLTLLIQRHAAVGELGELRPDLPIPDG
ncbi:MAG: hypothetical protein IT162_11535 [Bryobacterales bacterium]|nr:hypothetical protein [Bryobacterales bacterium]